MNLINILKTFYNFLEKGGPVMIPIVLCSIIGLAIIIERLRMLRKYYHNPDDIFNNVRNLIADENVQEAINYCNKIDSPISDVAEVLLEGYSQNQKQLDKMVDEVIVEEMPKLEKHVGVLGIIANIAPLLGLLGTVTGMIKAFTVVSQASLGDPTKLAGGISEALITTAAGLVVGIPTLAAYNYILIKIDTMSWGMEKIATKLMNFLRNKDFNNEV